MILNTIGILLAVCVLAIAVFAAWARAAGNAQYRRYSNYTVQALAKSYALKPFEVKPEFRKIHPAKMLKLFKILVSSYTSDRLARVNSLDATMFVFMKMYTLMIRPDYSYNLPML
jgi:hypothetical protein